MSTPGPTNATATGGDHQRAVLPNFSHPDDHIGKQLALRIEPGDARVVGRLLLRPSMWGLGSMRPRLSLLAMAMDSLSGFLPEPVRVPTIDLRVQLLSEPPSEGWVEIVGEPLRVGRRLIVSEFDLRDDAGHGFGRGIATMSNNPFDGWEPDDDFEPASPVDSFDRLLNARVVDERSLELNVSPLISNGLIPTPHGGAQMLFCELAAEHLAGEPRAAVDIDVHFLRPGKMGPLRATATHLGDMAGLNAYRVDLTDVGARGALVAAVTILTRPLEPNSA